MPAYPETVNKPAVAAAFSKAASSYDAVASFQREVGEQLFSLVPAVSGPQLLDAGCGTGYFSQRWRQQGKHVTALDLAPGMLAYAEQQQAAHQYLLGDIEQLPLADASMDICFSSLVLQWCNALPQALSELYRVTRPGGVILFATLAAGSLQELDLAWQQVDGHNHVNHFLAPDLIQAACSPYRHQLWPQHLQPCYTDLLSLLGSLKGIGATHLHQGRAAGLGGRQRLAALDQAYPRLNGQLPLSYQLMYGVIYRD